MGAAEVYPTYLDSGLARVVPEAGDLTYDPVEQMRRMDRIAGEVAEVGLPQLAAGFYGYRVVTGNVYKAMEEGRFEDPDKFRITVPEFADLSYHSLRMYMQGRPDLIPKHWQPAYDPSTRTAHPAIQMWRFWRGHIPDLKTTLLRTDTEDRHKTDYDKIHEVLAETAPRLWSEFSLAPAPLGWLALKFGLRDIRMTREHEWRQSVRLRQEGYNAETAHNTVFESPVPYERTAEGLQRIGNVVLRVLGPAPSERPWMQSA